MDSMPSHPMLSGRPRGADEDYRVALVLPRSGPAGIFGLECLAAAELAAAEIDEAGGVAGRSVHYVNLDAGGDPQAVARRVGALLEAGEIDAVTGWHLSNVRQSIARVIEGRIPYVYAAAYEGGEQRDGVLCSGEVPVDQILASLDWLRTELRLRRWFVVGNDYVWPRETAARTVEGLQDSDIDVVRHRFVPLGTHDEEVWSGVLDEIRRSGAQGVITLLVGSDAVRFNRAFAGAGMDAELVRFSPFIDETVVLAAGPEATTNLFVSAGWFSALRTASADDFNRGFRRAWDLVCGGESIGVPTAPAPGTMAETTYSGIHLLASIAGRAIPSVTDTRRAFASWAWDSPHGTVELRKGAARHPVHIAAASGVALDVVAQVNPGRG